MVYRIECGLVACLIAACLVSRPVQAQHNDENVDWIVIAAGEEALDPQLAQAVSLVEEQLAAHGAKVLSANALGEIVLFLGQVDQQLSQQLRGELEQKTADVQEMLADGKSEAAQQTASGYLNQIEAYIPELAAQDQLAMLIGNLCLYAVRGALENKGKSHAKTQATKCVGWLPDLTPRYEEHPPEVRAVFSEAKQDLRGPTGPKLIVQVENSNSHECAILVQGRRIGQTPLARIAIPAGNYQVEPTS